MCRTARACLYFLQLKCSVQFLSSSQRRFKFLYKICAQLRMSFDVRYIGPATLQGRGATAQSSQGFQLISPWASFRKAFALLPQPVAGPNLEDTVAKRGAGTTSLGEELQDVTSCVLQSSIYIPFRFIWIHLNLRSFNH